MACHGNTLISTVYFGSKSIEWLAQYKKGEKFPVYCYSLRKNDYTIAWAYSPRLAKVAPTIQIFLDNGTTETITLDQKVIKTDGKSYCGSELKFGDELLPFYKVKANQHLTKQIMQQFPRIYSFNKGWVHERQFIDEWRLGKDLPEYENVNKVARLIKAGWNSVKIEKNMGHEWLTINSWLQKHGFSYKELRYLSKYESKRRVIGTNRYQEVPTYELSVEEHSNFCTNSCVLHKND